MAENNLHANGSSSKPNTVVRMFWSLACFAVLLTIASCSCDDDTATIYVSHPQVFTRERLVVSRQRELQFLYTQLDKPIATGYQGTIDERLLSAFQGGLAANISPTPGAASQPSPALNMANLTMAPATTQATASNTTLSSEDQFTDAMAYRDAVNAVIREKELDDTHDLSGRTLYTLKFDSAILPGTNSTHPAVVVLTLKGDPLLGNDEKGRVYSSWIDYMNKSLAQDEVALTIRVENGRPYQSDVTTVLTYLFSAVHDLQTDLKTQMPPPSVDQTNKPIDWPTEVHDIAARIQQNTFVYIESPPDKQKTMMNGPNAQDIARGFWYSLQQKYLEDFKGMLLLKYSVLGRDPNGMLLIDSRIASAVTPPATMPCPPEFASALNMPPEPVGGAGKLGVSESDLYVDSIDPQEYAQNLSDVSSTNKLLSLSLGISALLGNSASVSGTAGYLQQTQKLLQSIERNPLAIGFRGGQKFGWLLGSPFKIQDGEPAFIHVPARQSFSVSFVAPVWLDHVTICANAWWIDNSGTISRSITVEDPQHKVLLPVDFSAISTAVNYFITGQRVPIVYEKDKQPSAWILQSGSSTDQTLLIVGPDLWRNPQVFVNSTKADTVDLLPDMNGLLAHFKNFPTVQTLSLAPLTVVTSFGESTVGQSVTILPPENKSASGPSATLASGFVVGGTPNEPLSFAVDPKSMPGNYAGFVLKVRQTNNAADWTTVDTTNFWRSNDQKTLYFPIIPAPAAFTQPMSLTVDLRLKPNAFDDPINLLTQLDAADRTVVYFPKEGQENPVLATTQPINFDPKTQLPTPAIISLTPTTTTGMTVTMQNLYDAYPGLQDSIKNGTAMLVLQDTTANNSAQLPLGASTIDTSFSVSLTGVKLSQLPLGNYNSLKVTFKATSANMPNSISVSLPPSASASQPPQPLQVTSK